MKLQSEKKRGDEIIHRGRGKIGKRKKGRHIKRVPPAGRLSEQ